jgi:CheY-like chemotaxis protein/anti-sigma regulatory factor (Ser/Thr protein kinase)
MSKVLVVDDAAVDRKLVGGLLAKDADLQIEFAVDGKEALSKIAADRPAIVVTDLVMPGMNGLDLVAAISADYPGLPVVLMTGKGSEEIAVKALKAGASSYVPKGALHQHLLETVQDLLEMVAQTRSHERLMSTLISGRFQFTLGNDPDMIPSLINYVQSIVCSMGLCDDADAIRVCIALEEAMRNAIFHGNLELTSEQREGDTEVYQRLVSERTSRSPYRNRQLSITVDVTPTRGMFTIRDQGPGFDPRKLPDPTDPANLERVSGRGLLLMRTFMDDVQFNETGNQVTMTKRCCASLPAEVAS